MKTIEDRCVKAGKIGRALSFECFVQSQTEFNPSTYPDYQQLIRSVGVWAEMMKTALPVYTGTRDRGLWMNEE